MKCIFPEYIIVIAGESERTFFPRRSVRPWVARLSPKIFSGAKMERKKTNGEGNFGAIEAISKDDFILRLVALFCEEGIDCRVTGESELSVTDGGSQFTLTVSKTVSKKESKTIPKSALRSVSKKK